jgi:histidinol-phosphate phosphatase family protein
MIPFDQIGPGWTLFLDRDGVINERIFDAYVLDWNNFQFTKGLLASCHKIGAAFDHIIVVTNQQCVAKKLINIEELNKIHEKMCNELAIAGLHVDLVLAATEFKNGTPARRKPQPQMALEAQEQIPAIDFSRSIMVGDTNTDIQFGKRLGMYTILIESKEIVKETPDLTLTHLAKLSSYL